MYTGCNIAVSEATTTNTAMNEMTCLLTLLAVPQAKRKNLTTPSDLEPTLQAGLDVRAFDRVRDALGITVVELSENLGIPERTIYYVRRKHKTIGVSESDRLYRVAELIARATEIFGSKDKAARWITSPLPSLGGQTPLSKLRTGIGVERVKEVLAGIQYGVYV